VARPERETSREPAQEAHGPPPSLPKGTLHVEDQFFILASSARVDDRTRILKDGDTFAVFDRLGDFHQFGRGHHGLYHHGTRHLSRLELTIEDEPPLLLSSTVTEDNLLLVVDLANPDLAPRAGSRPGEQPELPANLVHVLRSSLLWQGLCHQRFSVRSYALSPLRVRLGLNFAADFRDIFEVRGTRRERRGQLLPALVQHDEVVLRYEGLDGVRRRTRLTASPAPAHADGERLVFELDLQPQGEAGFVLDIACETEERPAELPGWDTASVASSRRAQELSQQATAFSTSSGAFNEWIERSCADLRMMLTDLPEGPYPYAGVPWYSTVFGRDGLITGFECLVMDPSIAKGVLTYLARHQATHTDPDADAEPGKILHEVREGEMAALGEIPFRRYYGSIDATPLFVMLAGAYWERTADRETIAALWPAIEAALAWMDGPADVLGDGFLRYQRQTERGLRNQGWKDSWDSVFHADGELAEGPIALCEVQAFAVRARAAAAVLAEMLGHPDQARRLYEQARALRAAFETAFWCEDLGTYALALDGESRPCRVRTSNAGLCLFAGVASPERAQRIGAGLLSEAMWSGWGVRTLATTERRYNPMSYHNGSVWPHDNALLAQGLSDYGLKQGTQRILRALFEASQDLDLHRLPELFCGFARRPREGPTLYPVACSPQSWAVASIFPLLQSCLGLSLHAPSNEIRVERPLLPEDLQHVTVSGLRLNGAIADITFHRRPGGAGVGVDVTRIEGDVRFRIVK